MSFLVPDLILSSVLDITPDLLKRMRVKAVVLDVDNTLTTHGNPVPGKGILEWIEYMKEQKVPMMIVSNNTHERVKPFAKLLGIEFVSMGLKPMTRGFSRACKKFALHPSEIAVVGDQIFTDIIGGNLKGMKTILVSPFDVETGLFFKLKRKMEKSLINKYHKGQGAK
ncbi:MAG: superfamily [Oscillospiraceae bacterium]|jgi:HAD superfamily phosphatase (TIGR01668 family)|nr:superfamily [Oscillospiraceae bacterium]